PAQVLAVDAGCGGGAPAARLTNLVGCRVVGVYVVHDVLRSAARRFGRRVRFVAGAAEALPIRSGIADQVWSLGTVAHVVEPERMAAEIVRVLRPHGKLAVTEVFWEGRGAPRFAATAPRPWRPLTGSGLMSALQASGV